MMSIKIGELIDQPRHVRIQAHAAAKQKKADAEKARLEKIEKDKATHKAMAAMKSVTSKIYLANEPMWRMLSRGEGDPSEMRRFGRKPELKLLVMDVGEMKMISTYNWQNMSTGALKMTEMYGLVHSMSQPGMPKQSEAFLGMVQKKVGTVPPSELRLKSTASCRLGVRRPV